MADNQFKIKAPCLLLCEGRDESRFLIEYLQYLLREVDKVYDNIQVENFGGINELSKKLKTLGNMESFEKVKKIAVIRDAETDWTGALSSIDSSITASQISGALFLGEHYLFPGKDDEGNWQNGTLEDLAIKILKEDHDSEVAAEILMAKSQELLNYINQQRVSELPRLHKNLLHMVFSGTDKFVDLKIGEAATARAFNWESSELRELKNFLSNLSNIAC